ncbi:MAG: cupin domain-containing protein [Clostridium lundense]|nr:cupin domain-containing protein [Clostridium lundense]
MKGILNMCDFCKMCACPYYMNAVRYNPYNMRNGNQMNQCPYCNSQPIYNPDFSNEPEDDDSLKLQDYGPKPFVINIDEATKQNDNFRTALWTGTHLQLTLMSIDVGGEIGLEMHPNLDQFIRIEEGQGIVKMGCRKDNLKFQARVYDDFIFIIPAGTWHNLINTGNKPIKLYSIYAPPQHPHGTVHETKADAEAAEENHRY